MRWLYASVDVRGGMGLTGVGWVWYFSDNTLDMFILFTGSLNFVIKVIIITDLCTLFPLFIKQVKNGSSHHDDINLVQHLVSTGHVLENCPSVRVTASACKGYLSKLGGKLIKSWKKRWFVLDRQKRALCYYSDEHQRVPKGIVYFQAIQDVYVDLPNSHKGSSTRTAFCVKTPQETYYVAAPSGLAMSIWIDAILTGREGANFYN